MDERRPDDAPPAPENVEAGERLEDTAPELEDDVQAHAFSFGKVIKDPEESSQA
jgi:hypothetical protein